MGTEHAHSRCKGRRGFVALPPELVDTIATAVVASDGMEPGSVSRDMRSIGRDIARGVLGVLIIAASGGPLGDVLEAGPGLGWGLLCAPAAAQADEEPSVPADAGLGGLWLEAEAIDSLLATARWETPQRRQQRIFRQDHPYLDDVFVPGEHLEFSVRYGPIRAGTATMSIASIVPVRGDSCYHIVTTARSSDFFSTFFYVNDRVESFVRVCDLLPLRSEKHLIEGDYRNDEVIIYEQASNIAIYDGKEIHETVEGAHDVLSAFYSVRARDLVPGRTFDLESHVDKKNYPIEVIVHGRERVSVPAGDFDCLIVEPKLRTPGLFKHQGELLIWLTDDRRRVPVQMKSKLPIGSISVVLTDLAGRRDWTR